MKLLFFLSLFTLSVSGYGQKLTLKSDTIQLTINEHNTIFVKSIFNDIDSLNLNFDTGTTELILTNNTIQHKLSSSPELYNKLYSLKIGESTYPIKLYDAVLTGHGTDGRFGWNLFKGKVVELNYEKGLFIIHSILPPNISTNKKYTRLQLEFWNDVPFVKCSIKQSSTSNTDLYLFDIGYQRTAMLDNDLLLENRFPFEKLDIIKNVMMKGAQGNKIPVVTANLESIKIGKLNLKNLPIQLLTINKPVEGKHTHILGNEVLKRFNTFLDFQNNFVYLKPNHLLKGAYIDQKKKRK